MIAINYANAFTEVYKILECLDEEEYEKIPKSFVNVIETYRNKEYIYEVNEEQDLMKQEMLPETKAILFNMYRDYFAQNEEKAKIKNFQQSALKKIEKQKQEKYNINVFDIKENEIIENNKNSEKSQNLENTSLIKIKKQSFFRKILNKIKEFLS